MFAYTANNDNQYTKTATIYPIIKGKNMAFKKIMEAPKRAPVIMNLSASIKYSEFTIFFGSDSSGLNTSLNKCADEKRAIKVPVIADFALNGPEKYKNNRADSEPNISCVKRMLNAVLLGFSNILFGFLLLVLTEAFYFILSKIPSSSSTLE